MHVIVGGQVGAHDVVASGMIVCPTIMVKGSARTCCSCSMFISHSILPFLSPSERQLDKIWYTDCWAVKLKGNKNSTNMSTISCQDSCLNWIIICGC